MNNDERSRTYPTRPYLAVSAAIFRDGKVLIVRRARPPANGLYTLPGGGVELGETLEEAVIREVKEETALDVAIDHLLGGSLAAQIASVGAAAAAGLYVYLRAVLAMHVPEADQVARLIRAQLGRA